MNIPLVRAQHLIHYIGILRGAGVAVERKLERARLPVLIEQAPHDYVSLPRALDWVWRTSHDAGIMDLGFLAGRAFSLTTLHPDVQRAVLRAPTGLARVTAMSNQMHRENSALQINMCREGEDVRVIFETRGFQSTPVVGFAEWLNIGGIISIVRSAAGPDWCPAEITFVSRRRPSDAALEAYGNARILTGQRCCSVLVAATTLAQPCLDRRLSSDGANGPMIPPRSLFGLGGAWDLITTLRAIIRPYLPQGYPHLTLVAEIAGMSQRTLQRRLAQSGWTYSQLVEDARFSIASELLADPALNITDIALAAGYDNPSHFSRAFKRITGMTPRYYRRATG